jgi:hypothetical protein
VSYAVRFPFGHVPRLCNAIFQAVASLWVKPGLSVELDVRVR